MTKVRESNFELLRIISMFFIVVYHVLVHGQILEHATGSMELMTVFIEAFILVHVNSFILITGYFQCKSKMKLGKVLSLNNATWFYKVVIMLILIGFGIISPDIISIIQTFLPIDFGIYWFISSYLILYLISPILNKVIDNSTKKDLQKIIIILFIVVSLLSTFTKDVFFNTITGRSLSTFILLYFIGAYIRLYPTNISYFMKPFTLEAKRIIYIILFLFCVIFSTFCWLGYDYLGQFGSLSREISTILGYTHISYASPIVILQSIFYFLIFSTLSFKSRKVNFIAKHVLGIYLIHENIYIRTYLYDWLGFSNIESVTIRTLLYVVIISVAIFIISLIIEIVRQIIFKFIYNSKAAIINRKWYRKYFERLGLHIRW